ncbi:hypothetical protein GOBAR_AA36887 [Gossypium barbadense]|uniref:Uncharacterized protein n=1 Tax=Gossypium barbadense TaxID=3634 RepID=A0A2P5VY99_GOSBA|nr:hypothetical protein GOBAR_AA36887 [Gossypium barbadense]
MAQRGSRWCGCELPTVGGPGTCSIFYHAIMPYFIRLLVCTGASGNIPWYWSSGIGQHRHLGASDVQERWAKKGVPVSDI